LHALLLRFDASWQRLEGWLCAAVIGAEVSSLTLWVVLRALSDRARLGAASNVLNWLQTSSSLMLVGGLRGLATRLTLWLALLGASLATSQGKHVHADVAVRYLPATRARAAAEHVPPRDAWMMECVQQDPTDPQPCSPAERATYAASTMRPKAPDTTLLRPMASTPRRRLPTATRTRPCLDLGAPTPGVGGAGRGEGKAAEAQRTQRVQGSIAGASADTSRFWALSPLRPLRLCAMKKTSSLVLQGIR